LEGEPEVLIAAIAEGGGVAVGGNRRGGETLETVLKTGELYGHDGLEGP
jgi:hypothetical protein